MINVINFVQQIIYVLIFAFLICNYVITAKSIYGIAKKLEIRKVGFSWVLFASSLVMANISDRLDDTKSSTKKLGRKLRLSTMIAVIIIGFTFVVSLYSIVNIRDVLFIREVYFVFTAFLYMMLLVFAVFMFFRFVFTMLCIYKIFKHIHPDMAVKYLILSLFLPLAKALLLRKCRNNFCCAEESTDDCEVCSNCDE